VHYAYRHFTREVLLADLSFSGGTRPGDPVPDFDLPAAGGGRIRKSDFVGRRPLLIECASITCPMAATAVPVLKRLHAEFGDRVAFMTLYVREAHPGERYPQFRTFAEKFDRAQEYQQHTGFPWPVAVDDVDGALHRELNPRSNAAWLMAIDGTLAFRSLVSNHERVLRTAIHAFLSGEPLPIGQKETRLLPALKAIGVLDGVLSLAGRQARHDFRRAIPPGYALVRLAPLFASLSPLGRGVAAFATSVLGLSVVVGGLAWWISHRPTEARIAPDH
jgi:hypothetical protein